ncbi:hypothetical protein DERP_004231 [Dermatophagoides pteronyssinus]|uniref:Uncharacterized protein n=1 Tax=Dermatophagoides pteronyssinus TaxID=6956 RepID=A0ABQ8J8K7_DERPT|nr:hypothetical protein DERP_004231 [Dermatophagoides pteronyssinus]
MIISVRSRIDTISRIVFNVRLLILKLQFFQCSSRIGGSTSKLNQLRQNFLQFVPIVDLGLCITLLDTLIKSKMMYQT